MRLSAWRATAALLQDLAVIAAAVAVALACWPNPAVVLVCVAVIGTRQHALFVIAHDAAHYLLCENRKLNDIVGRACAMLGDGAQPQDRLHHRDQRQDPEYEVLKEKSVPRKKYQENYMKKNHPIAIVPRLIPQFG